MGKSSETVKTVCIKMPERLKLAAEAEANRRGVTLSALLKNYLSSFLPENIQNSILTRNQVM